MAPRTRRLWPSHVFMSLVILVLALALYLDNRRAARQERALKAYYDDRIYTLLIELQEYRAADVEASRLELSLFDRDDPRYAEALAETTERMLALELVRERAKKLESSQRDHAAPHAGPWRPPDRPLEMSFGNIR